VIGDAREHVARLRFGIDVVQLDGADQAVNSGGAFAADALTTFCDSEPSGLQM